ncbi:acetyl-CoA C-acetyltransferase/acetyl-CoA acyltransferase [Jatrophihabitans sp. GAS493]|uniref:thiolase family protein n=1 Tax=Jatrophihabitans sp. GAS493 TaxID=1907575 RepID=UPI000BB9909D|nr:acetyl-CoA C-acyltransferase [Jatrophihabitans sp. GAS493]SOD71809.1 acetyl-CoA C-acetyltransferase/acetyl-CoA acyltransferase [Jatrophihabitans sp. GAS493]
MADAVIVDAVRTAAGKRNGSLSGWHPAELVAQTLVALQESTGIDPAIVDDVMMGCVTQIGPQSTNIARTSVLAAGWPETVPATTIDRQCGSSQQAIHFAAQSVMAGVNDVVVAAGVECMSTVPMFSNAPGGDIREVYGPAAQARYSDRSAYGYSGLVPQGISAELIADRWGLTREELDAYGLQSQRRAATARDEGRFAREIIPVVRKHRDLETGEIKVLDGLLGEDECIRATSAEALAALKPSFIPEGRVTAGNASQIVDGAAAVLIMSAQRARDLGLRPRAVIRQMTVVGADPVEMLSAPIPATRRCLQRAGLSVEEIDLFEVNEAFAPVVLAWQRELGADPAKVNVNGGGISLGHPLGASGAKLMVTLLHELERTGGRFGLQTMCEGGGMANATLIEVLT